MANSVFTPEAWDALHSLSFQDGDRVVVAAHLAQARERAVRDVALEAERARMRDLEDAARRAAAMRRAHEAKIEDLSGQLARTEARLASGKVSSEREVAASMSEIEQLRAAIAGAESAWLDATAREEEISAAVPAARAALKVVEEEAAARQAAAAAEASAAEVRLAEIDAARRAAAQAIPADVRERYRALFPRTGGRPFAVAVAGECSNCHRPLPASAVQMLRTHSGVPSCPSCGRLLLDQH
jgi:uncharacterized protein